MSHKGLFIIAMTLSVLFAAGFIFLDVGQVYAVVGGVICAAAWVAVSLRARAAKAAAG